MYGQQLWKTLLIKPCHSVYNSPSETISWDTIIYKHLGQVGSRFQCYNNNNNIHSHLTSNIYSLLWYILNFLYSFFFPCMQSCVEISFCIFLYFPLDYVYFFYLLSIFSEQSLKLHQTPLIYRLHKIRKLLCFQVFCIFSMMFRGIKIK